MRRECLEHVLVLGKAQLRRILLEYVRYFNGERRTSACSNDSRDVQEVSYLSPMSEDGCAPCRCSAGYTTPIGEQHESW